MCYGMIRLQNVVLHCKCVVDVVMWCVVVIRGMVWWHRIGQVPSSDAHGMKIPGTRYRYKMYGERCL